MMKHSNFKFYLSKLYMDKTLPKGTPGFTMLELMIGLGLIAIILGIAVPNIVSWLPDYRLKATSRELYSNMQKAKSEALKRNCSVGVAFTTAAYPAQGGSYTVFLDNGEGGGTADDATQNGGEATLFAVAMPSGCTLYQANFGGEPRTGYNSRGFTLGQRWGEARLRNDSRWYEMALANAGHPKIRKSYDGINWE